MLKVLLDDNTDNVGGESSTPNSDVTADSSQQQQDDSAAAGDDQQGNADDSSADGTGDDNADDQQNGQQDDGQGTGDDQQGQQQQDPPVVDKTGDEALPFNRHPRFKELVDEKNNLRREVDSYKTDAEQARQLNNILSANQIRPDEFQSALKYLIALRTNPQEAFAMLEPTYNQLALLNGRQLPADLQAEVASGTLTQERAQQIAQAQAQARYQEWRGQQSQGQQVNNMQALVNQTTSMWEQAKVASDPDFKPGSPLYQQTALYLGQMRATDLATAQKNCEDAYTKAKAFLAGLVPRTQVNGKRPPVSRPINGNNGLVMKTTEDVVKAIRAGHRPTTFRYQT